MKCLLERMETKDIFYKQEDFWENTELKMASSSESDESQDEKGLQQQCGKNKRHSMYKGRTDRSKCK